MDAAGSSFEVSSLRRELAFRILLQNGLLILATFLFGVFSVAIAMIPGGAWALVAAYNVVILAATLMWCHHGVRTMQIKCYLQLSDPVGKGWEYWLPLNRPKTLLGSRWLISTKGVFLGLGFSLGAFAWFVTSVFVPVPAILSAALWLASAGFLFTNPKE